MEKQEKFKNCKKKYFLIVYHLFYCGILGNKIKQMSIKEGVWIVKTLVKCKK